MNPAIEKLAKFLHLEAERGYDNRAVFGGLQNILQIWEIEAQQTQVSEQLTQSVISRLRDYPKLTPPSRREVLSGLWTRICHEFPEMNEVLSEFPPVQADEPQKPAPISPLPGETASAPVKEPSVPLPHEDREQAEEATLEMEKSATNRKVPRRSATSQAPIALGAPLTMLPGIGAKTANTLKKLGLHTIGDLLWYLPRRYDDYSKLKTINRLWYGEEITVIGTVEEIHVRLVRNGKMKLVEAIIGDSTGSLRVTWFNRSWIAEKLRPGTGIALSGRVDQYLGHLTMNNPEWEPLDRIQLHTSRIVPIYPLTAGVTAKWLRRVISSAVSRYAQRLPDPLPETIRKDADLLPLSITLQQIHFPDDWETLEQAQHRLAFDEMFYLQLGVLLQKHEWQQLQTRPLPVDQEQFDRFIQNLPFELTEAQKRALEAVRADLESPHPMNRLLQGDVGSGKTVVAAAAIAIAAADGAQSAFMAPTSVLAEQHLVTLKGILTQCAGMPEACIRLLIGSTPESEKAEIRDRLARGEIQVVVGTHALLEEPVGFADLGLAIIDEQHRFGVNQRALLRAKGDNPNLLVMTATPIPRSLALTLYGDLDLSVIDEMPPGRKPIQTRVLTPVERLRAYQFIKSQIEQGRQAFIICPLVEESEKVDAKAAVVEHTRLQEEFFADYQVGLLHGRMRPDEKEEVMQKFRAGAYQILVSTSVVEVGVDIPNTTVMLIEGANRFGLAQLHQFRGRVGRDDQPSYCLLIPDTIDEADNERLKAMESTLDGFKLAEIDLQQRGPGEFLGTRQSGFAELRMARITDVRLIEKARQQAKKVFQSDPDLARPEHQSLAEAMRAFWSTGGGEIS
jgi:ATP-dependent DNA helicase RecG